VALWVIGSLGAQSVSKLRFGATYSGLSVSKARPPGQSLYQIKTRQSGVGEGCEFRGASATVVNPIHMSRDSLTIVACILTLSA
jgi:hypothetical protein